MYPHTTNDKRKPSMYWCTRLYNDAQSPLLYSFFLLSKILSSSYQFWQPHFHCSEKIKIFVLESFWKYFKILLCWTPQVKNLQIVEEVQVLLFLDSAHVPRSRILAPEVWDQVLFFSGEEESSECTGQSENILDYEESKEYFIKLY